MATNTITFDGENFKSDFKRIDYLIAEEILNGTSESAYNTLVLFGEVNLIPVLQYTTAKEIAKFYGVSESYLKSVFNRNGITPRKMPTEAKLMSGFSVSEELYGKVKSAYSCYKTGNLCVTDANGKKTTIAANKGTFCVYSVRVFLAAAALMYFGRYIEKDSIAKKVIEVLEKSSYGIKARRTMETIEAERRELQKQESAEVLKNETGLFPVVCEANQPCVNYNIVVSAEVFKILLSSAVKEAIREALS